MNFDRFPEQQPAFREKPEREYDLSQEIDREDLNNDSGRLDKRLETWLTLMPTWMRQAYYNCPVVNRTIMECALHGSSTAEMLLHVAKALHEDRNNWRKTAEDLMLNRAPIVLQKTT